MDMVIRKDGHLYTRFYGRWYKAVAVFVDDDMANKFMADNENCGVIGQDGKVVVIADLDDKGVSEFPPIKYDVYGVPV